MEMIAHERPGQAIGTGFVQEFCEALKEQAAIILIEENVAALDTAHDYVLQQARDVYAGRAWHEPMLAESGEIVNKSTASPLASMQADIARMVRGLAHPAMPREGCTGNCRKMGEKNHRF